VDGAVTIAAVSGAAYYIGSLVGLELRLPPATPSVIWPPNPIVTALLLFVPPARWWSVLLGAAVAHFAVQLPVWSPAFVSAIFATNCSEALLAAGGVRYFSDQPTRFDTLRRVSVFLACGALMAPFASTFLDAAAVTLIHHEEYWAVWKMRFFSNTLAQLAIVPALAGIFSSGRGVLEWPLKRWLEAAAIGGGLVLVTAAVTVDAGGIGLANAPLAPFLPLLLWAAVRFGSAGVGLSVLATVFLAVASALDGDGLFPTISSGDRIRTLQIFLISSALPLMCVGALVEERRNVTNALRSNATLKSSILASIPSLVAVIARDGRVVAVNENWHAARERGATSEFVDPGGYYLDAWEAAAARGAPHARAAYDGVRRVLDGSAPSVALEYHSSHGGEDRWWMMSVVPLKSLDGGAVVTHTDVTAWKRAELEAQRSRDELAHVTRVWTMGELTASLSHQLNQPLTGIMGNAQAGRRFLDATSPNLVEVRHILADIVADAERAADVTRTIRDMLAKSDGHDELVSVNDIVRETTVLLTSQAAMRNASVRLQLDPSLPLVRARRVQLRQVILNLAMNAIEAMPEFDDTGERTVTVRTEPLDSTAVQVTVVDTGCGLPEGSEQHVLEPFFTTKASGMGMGLSIARSIVEAHGGTIAADRRPGGGTVVRFTLSVERGASWPLVQ
jgi:nitrogen-specific signal transduction histidine kinase/integral membrane sensor domain MASE1